MKKPEWVNESTLLNVTNHHKEEVWIEEHENPNTSEKLYIVVDTSGCDDGVCYVADNFANASNYIGKIYGFDEFWIEL